MFLTLLQFNTFFTGEFIEVSTAAATQMNTEVNFISFVALSQVTVGKFCEGFVANKATFISAGRV